MKLFNSSNQPKALAHIQDADVSTEDIDIDEDLVELNKHTHAYISISKVQDSIASENYSLINKHNYTLYNEYITNITKNLNLPNVPTVTLEDINNYPSVVVNRHLALEGFIRNIWEKIKLLFKKIYESIKNFFARHFIKFVKIKTKLENLSKVLKDTDKDIATMSLESIPSGLASKYPVSGSVTFSVVDNVVDSSRMLNSSLIVINRLATGLAKKEILDKEFITKINKLKSTAAATDSKLAENEAQKRPGKLRQLIDSDAGNKADRLDSEKNTLTQIKEQTKRELEGSEKEISDITSKSEHEDVETTDANFESIRKEFEEFSKVVEAEFNKVKGKMLINGKKIKEVKANPEQGLEIEFDDEKETPGDIRLSDKSSLIKLVDKNLAIMIDAEKVTKNYTEINDTIYKSLDSVDSIIKTLDNIPDANLGKYKNILNKKVKERLNMLKKFFSDYNKINKNLFELIVDTGEGTVQYTVLCLKYFGSK